MREEERESHLYPTLPQRNDLNKAENGSAGEAATTASTHQQNGNRKFSNGLRNGGGNNHNLDEKKDCKYFWRRVLTDLTNKNLIPVKILFFFKYATLFVLYPFLTIHMKSLGLDEWEIGINQASVPIVAILGPPVSGVIADKIGNFKLVLTFITLANAAVALLLLLVPVARETITLPTNITFEVGCDPATHNFILQSIEPYDCSLTGYEWTTIPRDNVLQCGQLCRRQIFRNANNNETISDDIINDLEMFPSFPLNSHSHNFSIVLKNESYLFIGDIGSRPKFECEGASTVPFQEECKITSNAKYDITTNDDGPAITESGTTVQPVENSIANDYFSLLSLSKLNLLNEMQRNVNNFSATAAKKVKKMVYQPMFRVEGPITFDGELHENPVCTRQPSSIEKNNHQANDCEIKCFLQMERKMICSNDKASKVYNVWLTFGVYTAFRLLLGFASATSFIMFEGAVLAILKQYGGDYGLQRVSATFAAIIAAPISGALLQNYSFRPVFYLYAALQAISAVLTLKIDLKFKKPTDNVLAHLKEVLSQVEILIFFIAMLCSGTAWGYLETFLFLFLQKLGGSETLMGLTITVGGLFGLPFLIFSRPLIKRVGHVNILCIGLLFYGFRYFGYSTIYNPWLCLPFEAMESITSSLAVTAAATYAVSLSTLQTIATVQGIMGALYFGIGRGVGSFIGGILIREFGHRMTFQFFGMGSFVACLLYMLVNILYIRRHSRANSGTDINNMNGLVISNGSAKMKPHEAKEQFQMKPANHDADVGFGKINPGFEEGDIEDGKFTDIPLDEDNNSTLPHNHNIHKRT